MAIDPKKREMPTQAPEVRAHNFQEVALGYTRQLALEEAARCENRFGMSHMRSFLSA